MMPVIRLRCRMYVSERRADGVFEFRLAQFCVELLRAAWAARAVPEGRLFLWSHGLPTGPGGVPYRV